MIKRRIAALLLAIVTCCCMAMPAFAEEETPAAVGVTPWQGEGKEVPVEDETAGMTEAEAAAARAAAEQFSTPRTAPMTAFERSIVEQGFRLLPYNHPFVIAYERTYGDRIDSYTAEVNGVMVSGVPFEMGGKGKHKGFSSDWWSRTGNAKYPIAGLDCAKYIAWVYGQLDITIPDHSTGMFFAGKEGVKRSLPGMRAHYVIPSLSEAKIGDIALSSTGDIYRSGQNSHVQMYIGTANILGISKELQKLIKGFPCDAHLVLDCGWSDGYYYYSMMERTGVTNGRKSMAGVGVQFFTSVKSGDAYLYESPRRLNPDKIYSYWDQRKSNVFRIESVLEFSGKLLQYNPDIRVEYPMNLSRPVVHPD